MQQKEPFVRLEGINGVTMHLRPSTVNLIIETGASGKIFTTGDPQPLYITLASLHQLELALGIRGGTYY